MADLFAGLEGFGLNNTNDLEIFEKKEEQDSSEVESVEKEIHEEDFLFDKTYQCPVCDHEFKSKMVRTGKVRLLAADTDLRPKYQYVDSLKYDAVMCPRCGYAALNRYFTFMGSAQSKLIRENISKSFHNPEDANAKVYDYDTALARHKLALLNTVVKKGKDSEKAYTCLKIAWLYRGKREKLMSGEFDRDEAARLMREEIQFLQTALEGFKTAFTKEQFPMCGMDQYTVMYLVAELSFRCGSIEESKRWVSKILVARDAKRRIKDKAIDLKERLSNKKE
jgi:uncharacterized protein (DUF2225 family)